jgi:glycosyltransferase involved in cell wall biosynthesis
MKRVLIYRNELLPASETFIAAQAHGMRRYDPWFAGLKLVPNGIDLDRSRVTLLAENGSFPDRVRRRIYLTAGFAPRLHRDLKSLRPALIHAHFALDGCAALPIQKKLQAPLVVTLHGYDVTRTDGFPNLEAMGRTYLARREQLWQRASLFVCVSEHIRETALARGFPADKLWVHRIGIDLHSSELGRSPGPQPVVLFVGRLVEKKGCAHLIRAMTLVTAKVPGARLVVVGDGPLRAQLESHAREQSLNAVFLGSQPSSVVRTCMRRAHVLAAPSVIAKNGDTEGLPIVLCEAQAMGLPVVGFRGPGVDEAVIDGQTAMLVNSGDHEALAAMILRLLADASLRAQLCVAGRQHAAKYFDLRTQTALLEDKYDEVLRQQ